MKIPGKSKYLKSYYLIIKNSKDKDLCGKSYEIHHILPKSLFPEYQNLKEHEWNGAYLTYRKHFVCHLLLWKHLRVIKHEGEKPMARAIAFMSNNKKYNSRIFNRIKSNLKYNHKKEKIQVDIDNLQYLIFKYKNISTVANELNVDRSVVVNRINRYNLIVGKCKIIRGTDLNLNIEEVQTLLETNDIKKVAKKLQVSISSIRLLVKKYKLKVYTSYPNSKIILERKWLEDELKIKNVRTISKEIGVNEMTITKNIKNYKLKYTMKNKMYFICEEKLREFIAKDLSKSEISRILEIPWGVVNRRIKELG